ncbi:Wadjet anti-phage system protein JetD domain-containing protein [Lysinibacillus sp. FSL K6-0057]|uniref:Wadjet anti-phage system protein JetD domain-containing protein n=1 Tax=Lysinibacillus sp. FSL K6-0057 TaxID=2921411 RepID=UPI00315AAA2E
MNLSKTQKLLLNELIDKYEKKQGYGTEQANKRGTIIDVKKFFKNYTHVSNSIFKNEINFELVDLEKKQFIKLQWEKYYEDEYLEKVYLNEAILNEIYSVLGRVPKIEKCKVMRQVLLDFRKTAMETLYTFIDANIEKLERFETPNTMIDLDNISLSLDLLKGLSELITPKDKEISKRQWSILLYNDSKRWEALESKIISVVKKEIYPEYDGLTTGTILGEFGIIENPKAIDICGYCVMSKDGKEVDFSIDENGIGMYPSFFRHCEIVSIEVERIVTIENKTSYHDYLACFKNSRKKELVIYLGGFHNQIRTTILKKLSKFVQMNNLNIPFYHWGDIDLGGLSILVNLRNKIGVEFKPLLMDEKTYLENIEYGKQVNDSSYFKKIESLLESEPYREFKDLIELLLLNKIIIEQESIDIEKSLDEK